MIVLAWITYSCIVSMLACFCIVFAYTYLYCLCLHVFVSLTALSLEGRRHYPAPLSVPRPPRVWHSPLVMYTVQNFMQTFVAINPRL